MKHFLSESFFKIVTQIVNEKKSLDEWAEIESDDMFQTEEYVGGYDATEKEFCFGVFIDSCEYWFQLSLDDIHKLESLSKPHSVDIQPAEKTH